MRNWRLSTLALIVWTVLALVVLVVSEVQTADSCTKSGLGSGCTANEGLVAAIVAFLWFWGALLIWIARQRASVRRARR